MEPRGKIYSKEQDELNSLRKYCGSSKPTKTASPKKISYGRRQRQRAVSSPGRGNMAASWPSDPVYAFQYTPSYQPGQTHGSDQVEEMEVDHLQDPAQQRKDNAVKINSTLSTTSKLASRTDTEQKPIVNVERKQVHKSRSAEDLKGNPIFIILHVNRIEVRGQSYPAVSPVKISNEHVTFNTGEKESCKGVSYRIQCTHIVKFQTSFTTPPFNITMTVVDPAQEKQFVKEENSKSEDRNNQEVISFYLAYEKDIPKKVKDDLNELFHRRLGVLEGQVPNSPLASTSFGGSVAVKRKDHLSHSPNRTNPQGPQLDGESSPQTNTEMNVRKRSTPRSLSMIERQRLNEDQEDPLENKVARRCLSAEFIDSSSQLKTLEVEAAEYQLLAAQRRLRIHALEEQVIAKNREVEHLRRNIHESSSSLTSLLENERRRCTVTELQLSEQRIAMDNLRGELLLLQTSIAQQRLVTEEKEQAILVRDEQLQRLRSQLNESLNREQSQDSASYDQLVSELEEARESAERARKDADDKRSREEHLLQQLRDAQEHLLAAEEQLDEEINNKNRLLVESDHASDLERMVECLQRDLENEEGRRRRAENEHSDTRRAYDDLQQRLASTQQQLQDMTREKDTVTLEKEDFEREAEAAQQRQQQCEVNLRLAQIALDESRRSEPRDWVIDREEIELSDRILGVGAWGCVKVGRFRGTDVAVKQIHQLILSPHNRRLFEREMTIAARCRHPCLLQFIGATCDDGSPLFLAEMLETDLRRLLTRQTLEFRDIVVIFLDISRALSYLHSSRPAPIIHRDISSSNVLMWDERQRWRAKLSDYGAANFMRLSMSCNPGASLYSAPEAGTSEQTPKLDIFSFGILLCETCIRELPVPSDRDDQISRIPSQRCKDLVLQCVEENPESRPSALTLVDLLSQWNISSCGKST